MLPDHLFHLENSNSGGQVKAAIARDAPQKPKKLMAAECIKQFHPGGLVSDRLIPEIILPEGYNGKILLVSVSGEGIEKTTLLRSGDLWHREILRNTEAEIKTLGFESARVHELGGALVGFEADGAITIYGASEEFGACDKEYAAEIIKKKFGDRTIKIRH